MPSNTQVRIEFDAEITRLNLETREMARLLDESVRALNYALAELENIKATPTTDVSEIVRDEMASGLIILTSPAIDSIIDAFGNTIAQMLTSGPTAINYLTFGNGTTGGPVDIGSASTGNVDADVDINFDPRGVGILREKGVPVAIGNEQAAPDTSAVADAPTKAVLDALITILQGTRILV